MPFNLSVVGLGNIGMGYDYHCPDDTMILTHASAAYYHPAFNLVAGVDTDKDKCRQFKEKYRASTYDNVAALAVEQKTDIFALAVPTVLHESVFFQVLASKPRLILCEKPIATETYQAEKMILAAKQQGVSLIVNYMRRFDPTIIKFKKMLADGVIGDVYKIVAYYSKGLLNNGSHLIDLLFYLFDKSSIVNRWQIINKGREWNGDIEPDIFFTLNECDIYFLAAKHEFFSHIHISFLGTEGKAEYNGQGEVKIFPVTKNAIYSDYSILSETSKIIKTEVVRSQWNVLDHLAKVMQNEALPLSTGDTAMLALSLIEQIRLQREKQ